jgi:peptide/nickel transport system substrate-binding protein
MLQYTVRKLVHTAFVALGVVTLVFVALRLSGDPAATMLPGDASVDELRALRQELGLDRPFPVQYLRFLGDAVTGDFGTSFRHQQPALPLVLERLPATVNPTTLRIVTRKPDPLVPVRLAQMGSQIYPARFATDEAVKELARKPIGSGAYRFVEWVKDDRLVMEANREWWGWGGKPPAVERLVWKPIPDDFARISALQKGEVDIITNVPPDQMKTIRTLAVPSTRTVMFQITATQPPVSDKRVRQAMHYALDVPSIVSNLYAGQGKPLGGWLADTDFGHNPALKPYPHDPGRAKALLAEAGHPSGIDVTLYAGGGTMVNDKQLLEAIADMWSKVGIRAKVVMMEMAARQKMLNERAVPANGLLLVNPQSTLLDADGSLWRVTHPNGFGGKSWAGSQPGHRFHDLMEQARYTLDQNKRKQLYAEATQIIHDEKPYLELFQDVVIYGVSPRVSFKPRPDYRLIAAEIALGGP